MLYNVLWTSWHCLFAYLFDKDAINAKYKEEKDFAYKAP